MAPTAAHGARTLRAIVTALGVVSMFRISSPCRSSRTGFVVALVVAIATSVWSGHSHAATEHYRDLTIDVVGKIGRAHV